MSDEVVPKSWKLVKRTIGLRVTEEGDLYRDKVALYLDPAGAVSFVHVLPVYVQGILGVNRHVRAASPDAARSDYERFLNQYHQHMKEKKADPVIILYTEYCAEEKDLDHNEKEFTRTVKREDGFTFSRCAHDPTKYGITVSYELAFRIGERLHYRDERYDTPRVGGPIVRLDRHATVLDYTPEIHEKIDQIIAVVNNSALTLHRIIESKDVATALLQSPRSLLGLSDKKEKENV